MSRKDRVAVIFLEHGRGTDSSLGADRRVGGTEMSPGPSSYNVGRARVRQALAQRLGVDTESLRVCRWVRCGTDALVLRAYGARDAAYFSVSHTPCMSVLAMSSRPYIGIDVERIRQLSVPAGLAATRVSKLVGLPELATLRSDRAYLEAWTHIEAFWKASGETVARFDRRRGSMRSGGTIAAGIDIKVSSLNAPCGYVAAVARWEPAEVVTEIYSARPYQILQVGEWI